MNSNYFGDIENGEHSCTIEEIHKNAWLGIKTKIDQRFNSNGFSIDQIQADHLLKAELPELHLPLSSVPPDCLNILELIQFCHKYVNRPLTQKYKEKISNRFYDTSSAEYAGQAEFRDEINLIFYRNSIIYRIEEDGTISRAIPKEMQNFILNSEFQTEDSTLNGLMDTARIKFQNPDLEVRKESLEKLWDAWERLKTLEPAIDKRNSITKLLDKVSSEPQFRQVLETESDALRDIGNGFMIRHTETNKIKIESPNQVDYFFYRLFSLIYLVLKSTKRIR